MIRHRDVYRKVRPASVRLRAAFFIFFRIFVLMENKKPLSLPENAQRPLKEGEEYKPLLSPQKNYAEVTPYSVTVGVLMAILFSAAAKVAIIAVGMTSALRKKDGLAQNVIIQSIGGCSGSVVAGAIFTLPAIYILGIEVNFFQMVLSSLLGGVLGILFLIPFRKYFVKEMHGKYPFPEATATTQVLVSGEGGGSSAKTLVAAGVIGGLYDFIIATFGAWAETVSTTVMGWGAALADKAKVVLKMNTGAAVLGLGYIVGLKYSFIICCGSLLVWLVIIPLMNLIWGGVEMSPDQIFKDYARHIGIGGIATAGVIGIIKSFSVIKSAASLAVSEFRRKPGAVEGKVERTEEDMPMKTIVWGIVIALICIFAFFAFGGVVNNVWQALVGLLIVAVISFLFTTVAANAIAIVGSNPVSGMTLMTLIVASLVLVAVGLKGNAGMVAALVIGGVLCGDSLRGDAGAEQDLWLYGGPGAGRSPGQCHGGGHPALDVGLGGSLAPVRHRRRDCHRAEFLQGTGPALRPRNVHSDRPEPSARGRRRHLLVRVHAFKRRGPECRPAGKRHAHRFRLHRRRRADGRGECHSEIRERGPLPHRVECRLGRGRGDCSLPGPGRLYDFCIPKTCPD